MTRLHLERVNFQTARQCVERFHYSKTCTTAIANYGAFEDGNLKGVVMLLQGAASCIASPFNLKQQEVRELVRVALNNPKTAVSKIVSIALMLFRREFPDVKIIVSYADTAQGHTGTIYQAGNWIYLGAKQYHVYEVNGQRTHPKSLHARYGKGGQSIPWLRQNIDPQARRIKTPAKHKYIYVYDSVLRKQWQQNAKPYPKTCVGSSGGGTPNDPVGRGGFDAIPTLCNGGDK